MGRLNGKVALITGAATGLGEADAKLMAKEGAKVVITTNRKISQGEALAEAIRKARGEAEFVRLDVTNSAEWKAVIDHIIARYGKLNVLVNNAGISMLKNIEQTSPEDWNQIMNVNATGVFLGTKYAIEAMKKQSEPCSIINISSIEAITGEPFAVAYNASKGAVRSLSNTAALHCAEEGYNIRVNSVYPGYINTPMAEQEAKEIGMTIKQYFDRAIRMTPLGHVGEPDDVAFIVVYLASDESKFVTGAEFVVDGGWTAK
jgi:NAD(P)-dependent dehydrogenase (short-subunit alcohol dehydrogenase family)